MDGFERLKQQCKGKLVGGQADGGKNINQDKLIGEGLVIEETFFVHDTVQPPPGCDLL